MIISGLLLLMVVAIVWKTSFDSYFLIVYAPMSYIAVGFVTLVLVILIVYYSFRKRNKNKYIISVMSISIALSLIIPISYSVKKFECLKNDYLQSDSQFNIIARQYMPSQDELNNAQEVNYYHSVSTMNTEILCATTYYSDDEYYVQTLDLGNRYSFYNEDGIAKSGYCLTPSVFEINGYIYSVVKLDQSTIEKNYVAVVGINNSLKSISYLFVKSDNLTVMGIDMLIEMLLLETKTFNLQSSYDCSFNLAYYI